MSRHNPKYALCFIDNGRIVNAHKCVVTMTMKEIEILAKRMLEEQIRYNKIGIFPMSQGNSSGQSTSMGGYAIKAFVK